MEDFRPSLRAGVAIAAFLAVSTISVSAYGAGAMPDISGTYQVTQYDHQLQIVGGGDLPLTEVGLEAYEMNKAGLADDSIIDAARMYCVPDGIPRAAGNPYPFEVIQAPPGQVTIIYELNHQIRTIALDTETETYEDLIAYPFYNGHSYGRFEGDTLVVESIGFNTKTWLDAVGAPHTDRLFTTERIRKIGDNQLETVITISDPEYYTREFQVRYVYNQVQNVRLEDYVCGEEHRDISNIPGVAEALAARAAGTHYD